MNFGLTYYVGIFVGTYILYYKPSPKTYPPVTLEHYCPPNPEPMKGTVYSIPFTYTYLVALE